MVLIGIVVAWAIVATGLGLVLLPYLEATGRVSKDSCEPWGFIAALWPIALVIAPFVGLVFGIYNVCEAAYKKSLAHFERRVELAKASPPDPVLDEAKSYRHAPRERSASWRSRSA